MTIHVIDPDEVLANSRKAFGICSQPDQVLEKELVAALIRHTSGFLCPCSPSTLRAVILESLQYLYLDLNGKMASFVDLAIEGLVVGGDLLELSHGTITDDSVKSTWLFAAPPSYVVRPSGSIFLVGIVPDQDTFLPRSLSERITHEGFARMICPKDGENLTEELSAFGLRELSQTNWLRTPKYQTSNDLLNSWKSKLYSQAYSGNIVDLKIIDPTKSVLYYPGRWISPKDQSGFFVGRRPQQFGAPKWCLIELDSGEPKKLLDLPLPNSRWRGCDDAWHIQMAIDNSMGGSQKYQVRERQGVAFIDFYSPIPTWAERRLMIVGNRVEAEQCLFSYQLPIAELEAEENFIRKYFWLARNS